MKDRSKDLKEKSQSLNIGMVAPGTMYKFTSLFAPDTSGKKVTVSIGDEDDLIKGLINNIYDLIFINHHINIDGIIAKKVMVEHLYISISGGDAYMDHYVALKKDKEDILIYLR